MAAPTVVSDQHRLRHCTPGRQHDQAEPGVAGEKEPDRLTRIGFVETDAG